MYGSRTKQTQQSRKNYEINLFQCTQNKHADHIRTIPTPNHFRRHHGHIAFWTLPLGPLPRKVAQYLRMCGARTSLNNGHPIRVRRKYCRQCSCEIPLGWLSAAQFCLMTEWVLIDGCIVSKVPDQSSISTSFLTNLHSPNCQRRHMKSKFLALIGIGRSCVAHTFHGKIQQTSDYIYKQNTWVWKKFLNAVTPAMLFNWHTLALTKVQFESINVLQREMLRLSVGSVASNSWRGLVWDDATNES